MEAWFFVVCVLYTVPLMRFGLWPLRVFRRVPETPRAVKPDVLELLGRMELYGALPRDLLVGVAGAIMLLLWLFGAPLRGYGATLLLLVLVSWANRRLANRRAAVQLLRYPDAHPDDFFRCYARACSFWPPPGPIQTRSLATDCADFTDRKPLRRPINALYLSCWDTMHIVSLILQASGRSPNAEFIRLFDSAARLWSTRTAWHFRLRLEAVGLEHLKDVREQAVVCLNHESLLDFCLSFYAIGGTRTARGRRLRPRFIAAKDHFQDNVFIHSVLGVGRAMSVAGMIYVDRKTPGAAGAVVADSVQVLRDSDVDLAIFPQGTRASPHWAPDGTATGAGYYTTAKRIPGQGHFRRGAAAIAFELSRHKPVDVVCVGITGTAQVLPARSFAVRTHTTVRYDVLPPIHIHAGSDANEEALLLRIERRLRRTARVNERLLETAGLAQLRDVLEEWALVADPIPYATLDAILSLPFELRVSWVDEFEALAKQRAGAETWRAFRARLVG